MAQYTKYWSCTKLADSIRGSMKPKYAESKGWKEWESEAKLRHPIRYWIAEEGLDYLQDIVYWPYNKLNSIRYYINNRWVSKSHALTAHSIDIKPGSWCDVGYRFLFCLFNELVDFVEIEKAAMMVMWDEKAKQQYKTPWWRRWYRQWRCPEAGIAHLDWESSLVYNDDYMDSSNPLYGTPTPQAQQAMEIKELYTWWTQVYRNRPDPYDISGWNKICERNDDWLSMLDTEQETAEQKLERKQAHEKLKEIEKQYEDEEEEMLIRLIKVRNSLWT